MPTPTTIGSLEIGDRFRLAIKPEFGPYEVTDRPRIYYEIRSGELTMMKPLVSVKDTTEDQGSTTMIDGLFALTTEVIPVE